MLTPAGACRFREVADIFRASRERVVPRAVCPENPVRTTILPCSFRQQPLALRIRFRPCLFGILAFRCTHVLRFPVVHVALRLCGFRYRIICNACCFCRQWFAWQPVRTHQNSGHCPFQRRLLPVAFAAGLRSAHLLADSLSTPACSAFSDGILSAFCFALRFSCCMARMVCVFRWCVICSCRAFLPLSGGLCFAYPRVRVIATCSGRVSVGDALPVRNVPGLQGTGCLSKPAHSGTLSVRAACLSIRGGCLFAVSHAKKTPEPSGSGVF